MSGADPPAPHVTRGRTSGGPEGPQSAAAVSVAPRHDVSILVLSVDEADRLAHALPAAAAQGAREVVVVDAACTDATADVARTHGARVVALAQRPTYAAAMNAGMRACRGAWVLWCNADCVLAPGALAALAPATRRPEVGAVVPRLLRAPTVAEAARRARRAGRTRDGGAERAGDAPPDMGTPREAAAEPPADALAGEVLDAAGMTIDRRGKNALVGHGAPADRHATSGPVFGGDGACVLYRAACLRDAADPGGGVLDEALELWASDADLAWRVRRLGWEAEYAPAALGWHVRFYSPSTRSGVPAAHRRLQFANRLLMLVAGVRGPDLPRMLPAIGVYEVAALGHVLLRERDLLPAYLRAARRAPGIWRRRRARARRAGRRVGADGRAPRMPFGLVPPVGRRGG